MIKDGGMVMVGENGPYWVDRSSVADCWNLFEGPRSDPSYVGTFPEWMLTPVESDGDFLTRVGADPEKWAKEFAERFAGDTVVSERDIVHGTPDTLAGTFVPPDELVAWFANAIGAEESKRAVEDDDLAWLPKSERARYRQARKDMLAKVQDALIESDTRKTELEAELDSERDENQRLKGALAELRNDFARIKQIAAQHSATEGNVPRGAA